MQQIERTVNSNTMMASDTSGKAKYCLKVYPSDLPSSYLGVSDRGNEYDEEVRSTSDEAIQAVESTPRLLWKKARERAMVLRYSIALRRIAQSGLFDLEFYLQRSPDVVELSIHPLLHFLLWGGCEGRSPCALFDVDYLKGQGFATSPRGNALLDYLDSPLNQTLSPHPLFDVEYYSAQFVERYSRRPPKSWIPISHFCRRGYLDNVNPHPLFDVAFYKKNHPDVEKARVNPLVHYLQFGVREKRQPHRNFDPLYYLYRYPDVASAGIEPLVHFVTSGQSEGRFGKRPAVDFDALIPSAKSFDFSTATPVRPVSVIIPIYRGLEESQRCIQSVLSQDYEIPTQVILIDDCSPEPDLSHWLTTLVGDSRVTVVRNEVNKGFVASVNLGMELAGESDVLLLNSDTVVPASSGQPSWLERLRRQAYKSSSIGTVCPQSNNATLCNLPSFKGFADFARCDDVHLFDRACCLTNAGESTVVPTAVGFCMYIKRDCLQKNGFFDEAAFGKGYGEEVDFCCRIEQSGWTNHLAHDVFVYHRGEVSFGSSGEEKRAQAGAIIRKRYPEYEQQVARFFLGAVSLQPQLRAMLRVLQERGKPIELLIVHALGGGVESYLSKYCHEQEGISFFQLKPVEGMTNLLSLSLREDDYGFSIEFDCKAELNGFVRLMNSLPLRKVHIHHVMGFDPTVVREIVGGISAPHTTTVHDYFLICPQVTLVTKSVRYCGEPDRAGCNLCIAARPSHGAYDIESWRHQYRWIVERAERVVVPSRDVEKRILRYFPTVNCTFIPHEADLYKPTAVASTVPPLRSSEPLRIAVLGVLGLHKGRDLVVQVAQAVKSNPTLNISIKVIGFVQAEQSGNKAKGDTRLSVPCNVLSETGAYLPEELDGLLADFDPHVVWFPSRCPETYSFTLSSALASGRPILASAIGSFVERLEGREWVWWHSPVAESSEILGSIDRIREQLMVTNWVPDVVPTPSQTTTVAPLKLGDKRPIVAVLPEYQKGNLTPCAAIRLLPYFHPSIQECFDVRMVTVSELAREQFDLLITHRLAVRSQSELKNLQGSLARCEAALLYDLDDNLLDFPKDHPEYDFYSRRAVLVREMVGSASLITVSTDALVSRIQRDAPGKVCLVQNTLDADLWSGLSFIKCNDPDRKAHILYMGTPTHSQDFAIVEPVLKKLAYYYGDALDITVIGVLEDPLRTDWCRHITPPTVAGGSYQGFVTWLQAINTFDIGIAPLVQSPFSAAKSAIKWLDYSAMGLATIASDVEPYNKTIQHDIDGLLVANSAKSWEEGLMRLIESPSECQRLATTAKDRYSSNFEQSLQVDQRIKLMSELLDKTNRGELVA